MEKVRTNQGGIAICVRLRTGGEGVLDFPHISAYVLCGWPPTIWSPRLLGTVDLLGQIQTKY